MRLRWTQEAVENLASINVYLRENLPALAKPSILTLYDSVRSLRTFPGGGRPGTVAGTRELVLPKLPYVIVYRIADNTVEVLHVYHGAQDRT